jgi:hypothetical protein
MRATQIEPGTGGKPKLVSSFNISMVSEKMFCITVRLKGLPHSGSCEEIHKSITPPLTSSLAIYWGGL